MTDPTLDPPALDPNIQTLPEPRSWDEVLSIYTKIPFQEGMDDDDKLTIEDLETDEIKEYYVKNGTYYQFYKYKNLWYLCNSSYYDEEYNNYYVYITYVDNKRVRTSNKLFKDPRMPLIHLHAKHDPKVVQDLLDDIQGHIRPIVTKSATKDWVRKLI